MSGADGRPMGAGEFPGRLHPALGRARFDLLASSFGEVPGMSHRLIRLLFHLAFGFGVVLEVLLKPNDDSRD